MKNLCTLPWVGFSNDPDGRIRPCCISDEHVTKEDGTPYYTQLDNIKDIFHSKYMNDMRQEFIDGGMPKNCSTCWKDEANGYTSKRQNYNEIIKEYMGDDITPEYIASQPVTEYPFDFQVILSNACNLKCRSCGSSHSTEWFKELKKDAYVDQETGLQIPQETIKLLEIQRDVTIKQLVEIPVLYDAKNNTQIDVSNRAYQFLWRMCESYELWCNETNQPEQLVLRIID